MLAPIFQNPNVASVIRQMKSNDNYECIQCISSEFAFKGIIKHLVSKAHQSKNENDNNYQNLLKDLEKKKKKNEDTDDEKSLNEEVDEHEEGKEEKEEKESQQAKEEKEMGKDKEGYLQFIHLTF